MPGVGVGRIVHLLTISVLAVVSALHLTGTIESTNLFAGVLIITTAIAAFQAGMQYSELKHS